MVTLHPRSVSVHPSVHAVQFNAASMQIAPAGACKKIPLDACLLVYYTQQPTYTATCAPTYFRSSRSHVAIGVPAHRQPVVRRPERQATMRTLARGRRSGSADRGLEALRPHWPVPGKQATYEPRGRHTPLTRALPAEPRGYARA